MAQDPNDEAASALLEWIRAERGKGKSSGKKKQKTEQPQQMEMF